MILIIILIENDNQYQYRCQLIIFFNERKTMKKIILINLLFLSSLYSQDYYFSNYAPFDDSIMSPEQFLGYPVGEMHTRHDL